MTLASMRMPTWALGCIVLCALYLAGAALAADPVEMRDLDGRVVQRTDERGVTTWLVYDASGRLVEERRSDGTVIRHDAGEAEPDPR